MKLRDYQTKCLRAIWSDLYCINHVLVSLATGAGKSRIFAEFVKVLNDRYKNSFLLVVNKTKLVVQGAKNLERVGVKTSVFSASCNSKEFSDVTIGSIQSIIRSAFIPKFDYLILDEAHRFNVDDNSSSASLLVKKLKKSNPNLKVVGFTATPFRNRELIYGPGKFFLSLAFQKSIKELTPDFLVPLELEGAPLALSFDTSSVEIRGGDFVESELNKVVTKDTAKVADQVRDALSRSVGRNKIIVLSTSIKHAEMIKSVLDDSIIIHSKLPNANMDSFVNGNTRILISVLIASEGIDIPEADCLWFMRPTRSPVLYIQAVGRILRKFTGKKNALLLDYGEIVENLGDVYQAAERGPIAKLSDVGQALKMCPICLSFSPAVAQSCEKCKTEFIVICERCLEKHMYGERCKCFKTVIRNLLKNTTNKAYMKKALVEVCDSVFVSIYTSKKKKEMLKIVFYCGLEEFCTHYLGTNKYFMKKFFQKINIPYKEGTLEEISEHIKTKYELTELTRIKNGKYWNLRL